MPFTTLITPREIADHLADPNWVIVDCRFALADSEEGWREYVQAHIPGAVYAHLNEDLSGPVIAGKTGRHPLPSIPLPSQLPNVGGDRGQVGVRESENSLVEKLSRWGIDSVVQVIAYDSAGGSMAAARLWWLLRWLGHQAVAVLDGGWQAWLKEGYPVRGGVETRPSRSFMLKGESRGTWMSAAEVKAVLGDARYRLLDSRTGERYRGENETIDAVAGHIPGAISAPYLDNLDGEGRFLSPEKLRARFERLFAGQPAERVIFYCGSGVTAAHNLLAVAHAGLGDARFYAGSWSEWITDPSRPVAT